jgi:hypothetical protein
VLSVLGVEPSHADAELVEWEDWDRRNRHVPRPQRPGFTPYEPPRSEPSA